MEREKMTDFVWQGDSRWWYHPGTYEGQVIPGFHKDGQKLVPDGVTIETFRSGGVETWTKVTGKKTATAKLPPQFCHPNDFYRSGCGTTYTRELLSYLAWAEWLYAASQKNHLPGLVWGFSRIKAVWESVAGVHDCHTIQELCDARRKGESLCFGSNLRFVGLYWIADDGEGKELSIEDCEHFRFILDRF